MRSAGRTPVECIVRQITETNQKKKGKTWNGLLYALRESVITAAITKINGAKKQHQTRN